MEDCSSQSKIIVRKFFSPFSHDRRHNSRRRSAATSSFLPPPAISTAIPLPSPAIPHLIRPYRDPRHRRHIKTWSGWPKRDRRHATSPDQRATRRKQPEEVQRSANRATEGLREGQGSTRREAGRV